MTCERMEPQLIAYLDGRASARERGEVEQHLSSCTACRARVEEFRGIWSLLDEVPAADPSPWFDARLRQRIAAEPRPQWWQLGLPQPRLVVATVALCALAFWVSSGPRQPLPAPVAALNEQEEFRMIKNMQVLENYEVLKDFDALNELQGD
jgi:anti-sigma factor RsiW